MKAKGGRKAKKPRLGGGESKKKEVLGNEPNRNGLP